MVRRAIELKPDDGYIIDSLGWVLYQRGLRQIAEGDGQRARELFWAAIEQLELALAKLERADPVITWHLGDAYRSVSRFEEALLKYRAALALDPEDDDAAAIRVQIELLELQLREDQAGADR
jgi:tetratricopeptide (TPR) repeat protein